MHENTCLREEIRGEAPHGLIDESPALRAARDQLAVVAPTTASMLIEGESGTGKELAARAIHDLSGRRHRPLISVPTTLVSRLKALGLRERRPRAKPWQAGKDAAR